MHSGIYRFIPLFLSIIFLSCLQKEKAESQVLSPVSKGESYSIHHLPGDCEDCNLMFLGMPLKLSNIDTTDGWLEEGQKLIVQGHIYHLDGKTPANEVIVYFYHTDKKGLYTPTPNMPNSARRHGHLRGWIKTGPDGSYALYTNRPAQYPEGKIEAHIHVMVKEPDLDKPYWIDEWIFEDDPLVTAEVRSRMPTKGGSGILNVRTENGVQLAEHDIILGKNIPGYPER